MTSPTTERRRGLLGSTGFKAPVTALAASNITLSGEQTIDGKALLAINAAGVPDRVLCTAQTDATQNGVWDVSTGAWTRSLDANQNYDFKKGTTVVITDGAAYAGSYWNVSASDPITLGTTLMTWVRALASSVSTLAFLQSGTGAVSRGAQDKMREIEVTPQDFGADETGVVSAVTAFQRMMTAVNARTTARKIRIPSGTYLFTVTGDADTILIPGNVEIECDPGVTFKWGYWGSPLFAIVNKDNITMDLRGALFQWTGTFGTTPGASDKFGYGRAIPDYEWCTHIICVGSNFVEIRGGRCAGLTTANNQNSFIGVRGTSAGAQTQGVKLRDIHADDVCQGITFGEQKDFLIENITSDRFSAASFALYGPPHVIYVIAGTTYSEYGTIRNVRDKGTQLSAYTNSSHSVSLKSMRYCSIVGIVSERAEGAVNILDLEYCDIDVRYNDVSTTDDITGAAIYFIGTVTLNKYVKVKGELIFNGKRNYTGCAVLGATGANNLYCELDLSIVRTCDGTEASPAIQWTGNYGTVRLIHTNKGTGAARNQINLVNTSNDSNFYLRCLGAVPQPRVTVTSGSRNTFWISGDSAVYSQDLEFVPANGNTVVWESSRQYVSYVTIAAGTANPGATFQLPKSGVYLVNIKMRSDDFNLARTGLYWVVFDDASVNDFTTAQLLGTQIVKGGDPSVLGLAVSNAGLCTVTSTAIAANWVLEYGYRQLAT